MSNVIQLHALEESHVPDAPGSVRVARPDCETFEVTRYRHPGNRTSYNVGNRTHFFGGWKYARDLAQVRDIIRRA